MKKLLIIALVTMLAITGMIQAGAAPTVVSVPLNPATAPAPTVDFTKPMLLNYSNLQVTVYFYGGSISPTDRNITIDDHACLNPNHLGFVIPAGGGINWSMPEVKGQVKFVEIFYGSKDPITVTIDSLTKSYKILPSADKWSLVQLKP